MTGRGAGLLTPFALCFALAAAIVPWRAAAAGPAPSPQPSLSPVVDSYFALEDERTADFDQTGGAGNLVNVIGQLPIYGAGPNGRLYSLRIKIPFTAWAPPGAYAGAGDTSLLAMIAIAPRSGPVWLLGLSAKLPTAGVDGLGSGKWSVGPAASYVFKRSAWKLAFGTKNYFSIAGNGSRKPFVRSQVSPQIEYSLGSGWTLGTSSMDFTYDWYAGRWTDLPIGFAIGKQLFAGLRGVDAGFEAEKNLANFRGAPGWTLKLSFKYHFPSNERLHS